MSREEGECIHFGWMLRSGHMKRLSRDQMEKSKYPVYPKYACSFANTWPVHVLEGHTLDLFKGHKHG